MPKANEIELNLTEVIKNTVSVFDEYDQYEISLDIQAADDSLIWADKDLTLRVFNNLIKNALQAIPSGEKGEIKVTIVEKETNYIVGIKDNGVGIKESEKEKIFVPYFTTKSTGTGLGLAMSKQIVESMNGSIWFNSEVGVGTTFFVTFPKLNK